MHRKYEKQKNNGFTLVELLVVVAVIAILSGIVLSILNSTGIQAKGRDAQRKADLGKIQTALEVYFADHRAYPEAVGDGSAGWVRITGSNILSDNTGTDGDGNPEDGLVDGGYINSVPTDPENTGTDASPCAGDGLSYHYGSDADQTVYILTAKMEVETSDDDSVCGALSNWPITVGCAAAQGNCYGVENP